MSSQQNAARNFMRNKGRSLLVSIILVSIVALAIIAATVVSFIKRAEPQPMDATEAIVKAFEHNQIVALGDVHGLDQERAFIISLIKNPKFAHIVQTIVIETGNAKYQQLIDDYLNGKNIDMQELSKVWRDLSVSGMGPTDTMSDADLFQAIRTVNQKLTPSTRLHVYLGDPPVDWNAVKTKEDVDKWLSQRDTYFAGVVEKQIYEKGVKGLIIIGGGHLKRTDNTGTGSATGNVQTPMVDNQGKPAPMGTANPGPGTKPPVQVKVKTMLQIVEEKHPHTVYVIVVHTGFGSMNKELEPKLQSWPISSIASIKGTWIGALDSSYDSLGSARFGLGSKSTQPLSGRKKEADIDGYLYLGPVESFTITHPSPDIYKSDAYFNELNRRHLLTIGTPLNHQDLLKEKPTNFLENYQQGGESYP